MLIISLLLLAHGLPMFYLFVKYGLKMFDEADYSYKNSITSIREKIAIVGLINIMKFIKRKHPAFFYSYHSMLIIFFLLVITQSTW